MLGGSQYRMIDDDELVVACTFCGGPDGAKERGKKIVKRV